MIGLEEFRSLLLSQSMELRPESVPLSEAAGRFPTEPVASPVDLPPVDGSVKKGRYLKAGIDFIPCGRLGPVEIAGLAAAGIRRVMVRRIVNTGFVTVGRDGERHELSGEVRQKDEQLKPSGHMLSALLGGAGAWPVDYGILPEGISVRAAVEKGLEECPVFILTGADPAELREFLAAPGRELLCDGVDLEGAEGLLFGRVLDEGGASAGFLFAFPPGAVAAFLFFHLFVRPFLYSLNGGEDPGILLRCPLAESLDGSGVSLTRTRPVPVRLRPASDGFLRAEVLNIEGPDHVSGLIGVDGCGLLKPRSGGEQAEDHVDVLLLR